MKTRELNTPWGRSIAFYWAFLWRALLLICGMVLVLLLFYGVIQILLESWPLVERLVRLSFLIGIMILAMCFALQWCVQATYGNQQLRTMDLSVEHNPTGALCGRPIALREALQVICAHLWRYIVVLLPINLAFQWLMIRSGVIDSARPFNPVFLAFSAAFGFCVGVWAMRRAIHVHYRNFRLEGRCAA